MTIVRCHAGFQTQARSAVPQPREVFGEGDDHVSPPTQAASLYTNSVRQREEFEIFPVEEKTIIRKERDNTETPH